MRLYLKTAIEVNDKDPDRCAISCNHIRKIRGNYHCTLFDEDVDTGDDDQIGYGFKRAEKCKFDVIGQPHVGNFAGDY